MSENKKGKKSEEIRLLEENNRLLQLIASKVGASESEIEVTIKGSVPPGPGNPPPGGGG